MSFLPFSSHDIDNSHIIEIVINNDQPIELQENKSVKMISGDWILSITFVFILIILFRLILFVYEEQ